MDALDVAVDLVDRGCRRSRVLVQTEGLRQAFGRLGTLRRTAFERGLDQLLVMPVGTGLGESRVRVYCHWQPERGGPIRVSTVESWFGAACERD